MQRLKTLVAPEHRDNRVRLLVHAVGNRIGLLSRSGVLEWPPLAEAVAREPVRDPVEHDRRDHLVGSGERLEESCDTRPDGAGQGGKRDADDNMKPVRKGVAPIGAHPDTNDDAHRVLALAADVEETTSERERDGKPRENERCRPKERLREIERRQVEDARVSEVIQNQLTPVPSRIARVGGERVVPRDRNDDAAHEEGEDAGKYRRNDASQLLHDVVAAGDRRRLAVFGRWAVARVYRRGSLEVRRPWGAFAHAASSRPPPSIAIPISSSLTPNAYSATISPSYIDEDAIRERQDLLQLERDEEDRPPRSRSSTRRGAGTRSHRHRALASAVRR